MKLVAVRKRTALGSSAAALAAAGIALYITSGGAWWVFYVYLASLALSFLALRGGRQAS